ncbi:IS91 family transposase [Aidingimonas halophila]|uniref:Transposase zinc-binding domain-containing protein n=1 Tax=Aidingimonas halophila TaxID=574349 RepID=A0A1H2ZXZ0_9GAMM|nr:IS91 family transposase [Aidingimonas halophila]SDX22256.1 Transposase zinc-binding domain-containing protein [Aidingimonas halophila]
MTETATLQQALIRFLDPAGLDRQRQRVCHHLLACRTEAMGGMILQCTDCDHTQPHYFGCRDRHCPQCQGRAMHQWAERQQATLLPVRYYHVVFTLPHCLNGWVQLHPEVIYRLLFQSAWQTLRAFGRNPKRLGGEMGMSAVLHTWGQTLSQHVHLHCLVPGGALGDDGRWRGVRGHYLFPVRALSRHFRGHLVSALRQAANAGELDRVTRPGDVDDQLNALMATEWVVYSKDCLEHTDTVVRYLARYTRRIAISNARILAVDDRQVTLRVKDYRDRDRPKRLVLAGEEFVRRFLLHVLPKGLMRVRHYGFLANRCRRRRLAQIRQALAVIDATADADTAAGDSAPTYTCPHCRQPTLRVIGTLSPGRSLHGRLDNHRTQRYRT